MSVAAEIVDAASAIAVSDGLERVTAKRVAEALGVYPGLVNHYFPSVDELVAAAFGTAASGRARGRYSALPMSGPEPVTQVRTLLAAWLHEDRDPISLLWLDAWQASRRRPALRAEVVRQMQEDSARLGRVITAGMIVRRIRDRRRRSRRDPHHEPCRRIERAGRRPPGTGLLRRAGNGHHDVRTDPRARTGIARVRGAGGSRDARWLRRSPGAPRAASRRGSR